MGKHDFAELTDEQAFDQIGRMIDHAGDTRNDELNTQAFILMDLFEARVSLGAQQRVLLHYFRANAFENLLHITDLSNTLDWKIPHLEKVILELRRAVRHEGFPLIDVFRRCQILTNLGNKLNSVGRCIEAIEHWDRAISLDPCFAMAHGNRGHGLVKYSEALYDRGHAGLLLLSARDSLAKASGKEAAYDSTANYVFRERFADLGSRIGDHIDIEIAREDLLRDFNLGRSKVERHYRKWALDNRLFLNPINDLGAYTLAAFDVLHLPSLTTSIEEGGATPPVAFGFYNQLKQEYVSARWLLFEGCSEHRAHYSDRGTHLYDTLGIPSYSLATEKTKIALRMSYSLLDKIAFFINDYFNVGLREKQVSFRSVWHQVKGDPKPLSTVFENRPNWPLRALYWLSKDIYEPTFQEVAEPGAEGLAELRNHLEHKYCQVYEDLGMGYSRFAISRSDNGIGYRIGRDMLEAKSLHLLQCTRAALIYLSLAVHSEEADRRKECSSDTVMEMPLSLWEERRRL